MANTNNKVITDAAESLVSCLFEMAEANTNPVLQVIDPEIPLEENKKYPAALLQFKQSGWRAYYHCHPASRAGNHRFHGEHGHFHFFAQLQQQPELWSHLAALAMDNMGQPLGWFTVNHWVAGENWASAEILIKQLENISFPRYLAEKETHNKYALVEQWLLSFLVLSIDKIKTILEQRDKILNQYQDEQPGKDVKADKEIYLLSEIPVNIGALLNIF